MRRQYFSSEFFENTRSRAWNKKKSKQTPCVRPYRYSFVREISKTFTFTDGPERKHFTTPLFSQSSRTHHGPRGHSWPRSETSAQRRRENRWRTCVRRILFAATGAARSTRSWGGFSFPLLHYREALGSPRAVYTRGGGEEEEEIYIVVRSSRGEVKTPATAGVNLRGERFSRGHYL